MVDDLVLGTGAGLLAQLPQALSRSDHLVELSLHSDLPYDRPQSGLMLAARITLAHRSVCSAMSFPKSAGEPPSGVLPRSSRRALTLAFARPAFISPLILSMISIRVFLGTPMPTHPNDS